MTKEVIELQEGKIHKIFTESLSIFSVNSILNLSISGDKIKSYRTLLSGKTKKAGFRPFLCIKMRWTDNAQKNDWHMESEIL